MKAKLFKMAITAVTIIILFTDPIKWAIMNL